MENEWKISKSDDEYEIIVYGNQDGPNPNRLEISKKVLADSTSFINDAIEYLNSFIDFKKIESNGDWNFEGFEFGGRGYEPIEQFDLLFSLDEDMYGLWYVRFIYNDGPLSNSMPVQFGRKQQ